MLKKRKGNVFRKNVKKLYIMIFEFIKKKCIVIFRNVKKTLLLIYNYFNNKRRIIVIIILLSVLLVLLLLDYNDVISKNFHLSVNFWAPFISSILTIIITLYIVGLQKKNEKKRQLLELALSNELFDIFYTNDYYIAFNKEDRDEKNEIYISGLHEYDVVILNNFMSKIKIIANSGLISHDLKKKCLRLVLDKGSYFSVSSLDNEYIYPTLKFRIGSKYYHIFSNDYCNIWGKNFRDENIFIENLVSEVTFSERSSKETFQEIMKRIDEKEYFKEQYKNSKYNFDDEQTFEKIKELGKKVIADIGYIHGGANFLDYGFFPRNMKNGDDVICVAYTYNLKKICDNIVQELSI